MKLKISIATLFFHLVICFLSIMIVQLIEGIANQPLLLLLHFIIVSFCYWGCGYLLSKKVSGEGWLPYFTITFVGILFWSYAFAISPNSFDFIDGNGAIWWFYGAYVISYDLSLHELIYFENVQYTIFFLLLISILPPLFILLGKSMGKQKRLQTSFIKHSS